MRRAFGCLEGPAKECGGMDICLHFKCMSWACRKDKRVIVCKEDCPIAGLDRTVACSDGVYDGWRWLGHWDRTWTQIPRRNVTIKRLHLVGNRCNSRTGPCRRDALADLWKEYQCNSGVLRPSSVLHEGTHRQPNPRETEYFHPQMPSNPWKKKDWQPPRLSQYSQ